MAFYRFDLMEYSIEEIKMQKSILRLRSGQEIKATIQNSKLYVLQSGFALLS